jgi:short subunit dehydrogenase-like uncharacterized protein
MARIVLFGATGYTGRLTAEALVARGAKPLLAARNAGKLQALAGELGGDLETASADVASPASVAALVAKGDVLVSTVGPFARWGGPAVEAAIGAGATYPDSTGEPSFIRRIFEQYGPRAATGDAALVTAFGYDWVPGNLAAALALERAGEQATRIDVGYFMSGAGLGGMSGGTRASSAGAMLDPSFAWRGGRIVTERGAKRVRNFNVRGRSRQAISVGSSEHFALPKSYPQLRDVGTYLGWFGSMSRVMQGLSVATSGIVKIPGAARGLHSLFERTVKTSTGGPSADERAGGASQMVAIAYDATGRELAATQLHGIDGYTFTGKTLAWGATRALEAGVNGKGALGPVDAFGLEALRAGVAECGIEVV